MKQLDIDRMVRRLFNAAGELAVLATLKRKTAGSYSPGTGAGETVEDIPIRLVRIEKPLRDSGNETAPRMGEPLHYALVECADIIPRADDDLLIAGAGFTVVQAVSLDAGAGILYEVAYR
ncbi:MAG: hypothetical protein CMN55_14135 [Sneathiella sp.]|jgi:hypothetical protein|uniref:hypothetical protein n=1 Tax=Sneathiella sp. TaxID=1964365 RepID=UPI000C5211EC|nr:hypothetical protein [Sneathiella sp.]MAL80222.1 hypothetical protein [Sneathiella sp.]|tara:strand:+ start:996 stop:1355 length:360 start_codon:yes stop_codon:yes gene_type:complete